MRTCLYLFHKKLRRLDLPSLGEAVRRFDRVVPIVLVERSAYGVKRGARQEMGLWRRQFYFEAIDDLLGSLRDGGVEPILLNNDETVLERLLVIGRKHRAESLVMSEPRGFYELLFKQSLEESFDVFTFEDDCLISLEDLPFELEDLPGTFSKFRRLVEKALRVRKEEKAVDLAPFKDEFHFSDEFYFVSETHHENSAYPFAGGESAGLSRLGDYFWQSDGVAHYKETRNGLVGTEYSSKLSGYLALGCVSQVTVYWELKRYERERVANESTYWLFFELLWREFFLRVAQFYGRSIFSEGGLSGGRKVNRGRREDFERWCRGETEEPFVNAMLRELVETGFMSNRGRQVAASYLVHGLKQDWREGAAFFEKHLIDYDVSSNWCNWMYVAGVGNDPRSRVFNVEKQQRRYDEGGAYCRLWT